uniref:L-serine deaminase n=1 Tax=Denticeps clupeoides TaxID=299321 RepID=A0AAY4CM56_9TELE
CCCDYCYLRRAPQAGEHAEDRWVTPDTPWRHLSDLYSRSRSLWGWTGSFKIRGVANQFARRPGGGRFVTMSAGNYGKAFSFAAKHYGSEGKVVMPDSAPISRSVLIQVSYVFGRSRAQSARVLTAFFIDRALEYIGFEILDAMPSPDVVVVCCGGGGLLAGRAPSSLQDWHHPPLVSAPPFTSKVDSDAIVSVGLAALPFQLCQKFVEGIVLVSDEEIKKAVSTLYNSGFLVEASGSAGFAAVVNHKIPDLAGKSAVVILSGGNIGKDELANFPD